MGYLSACAFSQSVEYLQWDSQTIRFTNLTMMCASLVIAAAPQSLAEWHTEFARG